MLNSSRTNAILLVAILAVGIGIVAMLATGARGGPLDPPAAPASTDGVREPGTPISSIPFTISAPGRYYLTRNLTGTIATSGVTISASDVTLDLHGFTLTGGVNAIDGVLVSGARTNIRIEHGTIRGWFNGIDGHAATHAHVADVLVLENSGALGDGGFGLLLGDLSELQDCRDQ